MSSTTANESPTMRAERLFRVAGFGIHDTGIDQQTGKFCDEARIKAKLSDMNMARRQNLTAEVVGLHDFLRNDMPEHPYLQKLRALRDILERLDHVRTQRIAHQGMESAIAGGALAHASKLAS